MSLTLEEARALAARVVALTDAGEVEALVVAGESALTRFADGRIHQSVAEMDAQVSVRAVVGKRIGVSSTNRLDDVSLEECARTAAESARHAPEDDAFPGLPGPESIEVPERTSVLRDHLDAEGRARAARAIVDQSTERGLSASGKVSVSDSVVAVANSHGVDAAMGATLLRATVLSMGPDDGSGWASHTSKDTSGFSPEALGDRAASLAERSAGPQPLDTGEYTVVLAPEAVADIMTMLAYAGFSAKAVEEGSSFMSGHIGDELFADSITIVDDALSPDAVGLVFDFEGVPKRRTLLVDRGVALGPVTDSYWAARTGRPNTGHALPAPNAHGPMPMDLEMDTGNTSVDDMIASVEHGVYVTRFHYVNVEDPAKAVLTGMTRDGTFLIESGRLGVPLKNLRFTQSAVEILRRVVAVGERRERVGEMLGSSLVPALTVERFEITGQTE